MFLRLHVYFIASLLLLFFIIFLLVNKNKISVRFSLVWLICSFVMFIFAISPSLIEHITVTLGFETPSNMIFVLLIGFLMIICLSLTVIVTEQSRKIKLLIQELSIMKENK